MSIGHFKVAVTPFACRLMDNITLMIQKKGWAIKKKFKDRSYFDAREIQDLVNWQLAYYIIY
jgi:hypothetical protein